MLQCSPVIQKTKKYLLIFLMFIIFTLVITSAVVIIQSLIDEHDKNRMMLYIPILFACFIIGCVLIIIIVVKFNED